MNFIGRVTRLQGPYIWNHTVKVGIAIFWIGIHNPGWWFGTFLVFPYIGNVIIPTDEVIFFRGVGIPPTS